MVNELIFDFSHSKPIIIREYPNSYTIQYSSLPPKPFTLKRDNLRKFERKMHRIISATILFTIENNLRNRDGITEIVTLY